MKVISSPLLAFYVCATSVFAAAPDQSTRPIFRPTVEITPAELLISPFNAPEHSLRPVVRFNEALTSGKRATELVAAAQNVSDRKDGLLKRLLKRRPKTRSSKGLFGKASKGSVCGVPEIKGVEISPIAGRLRGCGVDAPVKISSVAGVTLSQHSIMDCGTAKALYSWVNNGVKPVIKRKGGGVQSLKVAAHYSCRTRNNRKGARISEHGKGRAIDISAIVLKNGKSLTVLKDWRSRNSRTMAKLHKSACGPFGTVLGPKSDRYHQDHFHFDTARYRSGPYCR